MEIFFREKFAEFLEQNNQQIISNDVVTSLKEDVKAKEDELKNSKDALEKLEKNHQDQTKTVKKLRREVARGKIILVDQYVSKLEYEKLESTVTDLKKQLQTSNKTISHEKTLKLGKEQEVKELQEKNKFIEERERSLDATKKDLLFNHRKLEKHLKDATEELLNQFKVNKELSEEKENLKKQFIADGTKTTREIVALKNEIERLTMEQFKFLAFVREIVNVSSFQGYQSEDAYTVCGQLDSVTNHVKTIVEKLRNYINELELVKRNIGRRENQGAIPQENLGTVSNTCMSTLTNRSPSPSDRTPSIVVELHQSASSSIQLPQQNSEKSKLKPMNSSEHRGKVRSKITKPSTKRKKYRKGIRRLQREILKRKKHAMWITKTGRGSVEGRWWCVCGKKFPRMYALKNHIQYYSFEWKFQCEKCPEIFRFLASLKVHLTKEHGIANPLNEFKVGCSVCGEMFPNRRALGRHRFFICKSESGNETPHQSSYRRVILTTPLHTPNYDIVETVEISESESDQDQNEPSDLSSTSIVALRKTTLDKTERKDVPGQIHRALVTVTDDTETDASSSDRGKCEDKKKSRYPCHCTCGKRYPNRFALQYHIRTMEYENTLQCIECLQKLPTFYFLKKHMAEKHGKMEYTGSVGCSLCGKEFSSMIHYTIHFVKEHDGKSGGKHGS